MNQHLTALDYKTMPWANGLGKTVEILRCDDSEGKLLWRLSMAAVTEDGPFSIFTDVERNLTVLTGDGFDLIEDHTGIKHSAALLTPVAFSGETPISAKNVTASCQDFNVMTKAGLPKPNVWIANASKQKVIEGAQLALFALSKATVKTANGTLKLETHELLLCEKSAELELGQLICVVLHSDYAAA